DVVEGAHVDLRRSRVHVRAPTLADEPARGRTLTASCRRRVPPPAGGRIAGTRRCGKPERDRGLAPFREGGVAGRREGKTDPAPGRPRPWNRQDRCGSVDSREGGGSPP